MLSPKMQETLNRHLNSEQFSANFYLSMAAHLAAENLVGMAHWMQIQVEEERQHVLKFYHFILSRGGHVSVGAVKAPKTEWLSPVELFEAAYQHECDITQEIYQLMDVAHSDGDHATTVFMQWFVSEQMEEEAIAQQISARLKRAGDDVGTLFLLDRELGERVAASSTG